MEENIQLPKEVLNAVHIDAEEIYNKLDELAREACHVDFGLPMFHKVKQPIEESLTAYATKLHQLQQENEKLKSMAEGWRPLLEEVMIKHGTMILIHDSEFYKKIQKFLYGE